MSSDWCIIQWARKHFHRRVDVSKLIQCAKVKATVKVGDGHSKELLISINYLYIFVGEAIWLRVESKYNLCNVLPKLTMIVLLSVEWKLAFKLRDTSAP